MNQIIDELSYVRFSDSDKLDPESFFIRLKNFYKENPRHKYSEISQVVYKFNDDRIDILRINLSKVKEVANNQDENEVAVKIEKLIDHADLAENQRKLMEDVSKETKVLIEGYQNVLQNTAKDLLQTRSETKEAKDNLEETKEQLVNAKKELKQTREEINENYRELENDIGELKKDKSNIYTGLSNKVCKF